MINLIQRVLSGVIYIALIVAAILLLDNSPVMYLLVFPLLIVLGISELITMARDEGAQSWLVNVIDMLGGVGVFVAFYLHYEGATSQSRALWLLPIAFRGRRAMSNIRIYGTRMRWSVVRIKFAGKDKDFF